MQVVACALHTYALHFWHVMLVFTSLGAHRLHLFLLSPLSLAAGDLASPPCISLTNPASKTCLHIQIHRTDSVLFINLMCTPPKPSLTFIVQFKQSDDREEVHEK